jgi:hypothetical protein
MTKSFHKHLIDSKYSYRGVSGWLYDMAYQELSDRNIY